MTATLPAPAASLAALPKLPPPAETDARAVLLSLAHRRAGTVPEALLAGHVASVTRGATWPVARAAMEAVLRRVTFGKRDQLRVVSRPAGEGALGVFTTARPGGGPRPYRTVLYSLAPLRASCECRDFFRNSLGLCKHVLAVLEDVASRPRALQAARAATTVAPRLAWDPVRPLVGGGDWLARVRLSADVPPALRQWFRGQGTRTAPKQTYESDPLLRLRLVSELLAEFPTSGRAWRQIDPALAAFLREEKQRLESVVEHGVAGRELRAALRSLKRPLYPYQVEGVTRFLARTRLLLADDMGLGKTAQAIAACHVLWTTEKVRRGLVIAPATLKPQWLREWQLFTDTPAAIVEGSAEERARAYRSRSRGFLIVNYEQVLRDLVHIDAYGADVVVLDEAQRIKNWSTKTAAFVKKLEPAYRLVLTGTPMENRIEELASVLDWVDDLALEPKWRLLPLHTVFADGKREISGIQHLDTLRERLAGCLVRRVRKEVLTQLPSRTDTSVPVEFTDEQQERHGELDQPIARLLSIARKRGLTQPEFLKLQSMLLTQRVIANGLAQADFVTTWPTIQQVRRPNESLLRSLLSPKLLELREIFTNLLEDPAKKVVVFSQFRRMLVLAEWATAQVLEDRGARAVFFTGQEGAKRRTQNLVDFHDDPPARVLFCTDAGGVGLNLQRAAQCCVNIELPWNPAVLEQRIGRIYRMGQKHPIEVYNLITEGSIESRIANLVAGKKAFFDGLFDGASDEVKFERSGSFLSQLEKLVQPAEVPALQREGKRDDGEQEQEMLAVDSAIAAADEAKDAPVAAPAEPEPVASEVREPRPAPDADGLRRLLAQVRVGNSGGGGIRIDAPPEAAATLAVLFDGFAKLLRDAAGAR